jgi:hypothetical protein
MRENFDYVTFDNYSHDIEEISERARAAIRLLKQERDDARSLLFAAVAATGGFSIPFHILGKGGYHVSFYENSATCSFELRLLPSGSNSAAIT